jgi:hypothetical protein
MRKQEIKEQLQPRKCWDAESQSWERDKYDKWRWRRWGFDKFEKLKEH